MSHVRRSNSVQVYDRLHWKYYTPEIQQI